MSIAYAKAPANNVTVKMKKAYRCFMIPSAINNPLSVVAFQFFPPRPHLPKMGKGCMPQCGHIDVDAEKSEKRAGDQVMGVDEEFDSPDHNDPSPQGGDVHQKETADNHERQEHEHRHKIRYFLDGVKLVLRCRVMGILPPQKIGEEIEKRLLE